ncbi:MAG TPA: YsnF/AvaK domain-containing protein [Noviherbaspirillum sp.]|nr:YsnF/AvaK domain-containing protein [Noviherbaspirillum sp.]
MMATETRNKNGMLTGLFKDRDSAERAYQSITARGYTRDDVNVVMSDDTRKRHFGEGTAETELGTKAAEGAGIGGAVGGTLGAVIAAATAAGTSLALPGLGLVIAGPLAAAAAGAGVGAATGGLLGALVGWGIPEEEVKHYESGLKQGGILMGVRPRSAEDAAYIEQEWRSHNGEHIYRPGSTASSYADTGDARSVVAVFDEYSDAQSAVQALMADGFDRTNIQLSNEPETTGTTTTTTTQKDTGGGISGFFRSLFGSEQNPYHDTYAESARRGSYVLTVQTRNDDEADRASDILERFDPVDVDERATQWKQQGWARYDASAPRYTDDEIRKERSAYQAARTAGTAAGKTTDQTRIPVVEEELKVGKREVQRGGVRVFRRMTEKPVHEQVQLREEHVRVERQPVDKPATEADMAAFKEGTVELRESAEEAVVSKSARVVEEVVVGKEVTERTEQIDDTVRKTEVEVEQLGASDDSDFRRHWQSTYGTSGGRYEDYDAAYRYGHTMAGSDQYKNYQWTDVEPQLRTDWESSHPGSTWDKVKDAVRYGAERVTGHRRH